MYTFTLDAIYRVWMIGYVAALTEGTHDPQTFIDSIKPYEMIPDHVLDSYVKNNPVNDQLERITE